MSATTHRRRESVIGGSLLEKPSPTDILLPASYRVQLAMHDSSVLGMSFRNSGFRPPAHRPASSLESSRFDIRSIFCCVHLWLHS
ncbi:hypothetical protein WN51_02768 [Melipona quadrifasciata]|uniref:Uncharacterized protein n=1 Tax=Melipona quadrifasciata TaxID=166423 RepID=A0A0N1IU28_9HYME|nr:hypothetical protein WN51_02768 [Melipona quadrifasciata]